MPRRSRIARIGPNVSQSALNAVQSIVAITNQLSNAKDELAVRVENLEETVARQDIMIAEMRNRLDRLDPAINVCNDCQRIAPVK